MKVLRLPPNSPNLNAFAERWIRSIKTECLRRILIFGEAGLREALSEYTEYYHIEYNHQGKDNLLFFPSELNEEGPIACKQRLGGVMEYYYQEAA